jgi:hypothetical protein
MKEEQEIIIYNTEDGKASVALFVKEGDIWMNQIQLAELFDTSKQNISSHKSNKLKENGLNAVSVVKDYLTTAELRAKNKQDITMSFWKTNVDRIIEFNDKNVLNHLGVTHLQMEKKIDAVYEKFNPQRKQLDAKKADEQDLEELKQLENQIKNKPKK